MSTETDDKRIKEAEQKFIACEVSTESRPRFGEMV